jgi:hypothetical protein
MTKYIFALSIMLFTIGCGKPAPVLGGDIPLGTNNFSVTASNAPSSFSINGKENPNLNFQRGQTYLFDVNAPGRPFFIMTTPGTNTANAYSNGVTNQGIESGILTFVVPSNAPNVLYYNCSTASAMSGTISISN